MAYASGPARLSLQRLCPDCPARPLAERGWLIGRGEPFAPDVPAAYLALHPFGRVPTRFTTILPSETGAITATSTAFADACWLIARALGRMDQIIGVVVPRNWPLVRQVFSIAYFRPPSASQRMRQRSVAVTGLAKVLAALSVLAALHRGPLCRWPTFTLARCWLTSRPRPKARRCCIIRGSPRGGLFQSASSFAATDHGLPTRRPVTRP